MPAIDGSEFDDLVEAHQVLQRKVDKMERQLARLWQLAEDEGADLDFEVADVDE